MEPRAGPWDEPGAPRRPTYVGDLMATIPSSLVSGSAEVLPADYRPTPLHCPEAWRDRLGPGPCRRPDEAGGARTPSTPSWRPDARSSSGIKELLDEGGFEPSTKLPFRVTPLSSMEAAVSSTQLAATSPERARSEALSSARRQTCLVYWQPRQAVA